MNDKSHQKNGSWPLARKDVLKAIMSTPTTSELRFQGVDFCGANLSKLDLRNINFKVIQIIPKQCTLQNNTHIHIYKYK